MLLVQIKLLYKKTRIFLMKLLFRCFTLIVLKIRSQGCAFLFLKSFFKKYLDEENSFYGHVKRRLFIILSWWSGETLKLSIFSIACTNVGAEIRILESVHKYNILGVTRHLNAFIQNSWEIL